ncbi:LOW QUALITY PROTEIN: glucose-6-phosphatase catalytic subunit 1-like [Choristoneura fumiferana]|uniref:LOW QUALITY PROTEIN: glucose-6-phosphatase catalytic subunit 1-like n=1 Tax=Choristoneura fumiferana TaxID=7141 RepID=UPI003D15C935
MEQIYALGINVIEFVQYWFEDWADYLELVNNISNPYLLLEVFFPLVSILDSVFAAQLLLCLGFGGWLNTVMKWWILEDRPYWWVRESTFYSSHRPKLRQTQQTCEPGPGSPSGHSAAAAASIILLLMWAAHAMQDRKCTVRWWKYVLYPLCAGMMVSVFVARLFVAAHFPHQCMFGALVGAFLSPALCIYVSDPFIWRYGAHATRTVTQANGGTWRGPSNCAADPQWTVKLALRWCDRPENIHVTATPLFALAQSTATLLGWALSVTPAITRYRHDTKNRSLIISAFATGIIVYIISQISQSVDKDNPYKYYLTHFVLSTIKPALYLRLTPAMAMWPYGKTRLSKLNRGRIYLRWRQRLTTKDADGRQPH